jgi:hypothetical protein
MIPGSSLVSPVPAVSGATSRRVDRFRAWTCSTTLDQRDEWLPPVRLDGGSDDAAVTATRA